MKFSVSGHDLNDLNNNLFIVPVPGDTDMTHIWNRIKIPGAEYVPFSHSQFKAKAGETLHLIPRSKNEPCILLVGLGKKPYQDLKMTFLKSTHTYKKWFATQITIILDLLETEDEASISFFAESAIKGIVLGLHEPALYKEDRKEAIYPQHVSFTRGRYAEESILNGAHKGFIKAETIGKVIDLVNAPANYKTPVEMAEWMKRSANSRNYKLMVLEKKDLIEQGWHALLAVNRGSEIPAKCMIAEYTPKHGGENLKTVVLVGKGVTFDTGGLSIKTNDTMYYMKSDMGGAAAVMGTIDLAAALKLKVKVVAIVPTTDNSVDALAIKPGEVINSYSGKTIEVINTDAEGRLILADGLAYAIKNHPCDYLIDLATLTGNIVLALGTEAAGIMTQNDLLAESLSASGQSTGEKLWRMPVWDDYKKHIESDIADIKNLGSKPLAGAITSAKFLEFFTEGHPAYAHIDIAGTAFGAYPTTEGYSGTAFGVDLLIHWLEKLQKDEKTE